eukprot:14117992-Alexandrium_andersonii.AAC.1
MDIAPIERHHRSSGGVHSAPLPTQISYPPAKTGTELQGLFGLQLFQPTRARKLGFASGVRSVNCVAPTLRFRLWVNFTCPASRGSRSAWPLPCPYSGPQSASR